MNEELNQDICVYSVSEITNNIKTSLEESFANIWIEGEISNFKLPSSGHMYFTLKDENSQLKAVMFKGANSKLKFEPKDGLKVLVYGNITVYEKGGNYQINIKKMEPKGLGELQLAFLQLKEKLEKEGLFDRSKKKAIPRFPNKIGIVTSPTGAAIRDILNVLSRRYSHANIIINPAAVQGDNAKHEIAQAINEFNEMKEVEVIIIGRGGGSIEDLWAFNEELVAYAIFNSKIPIISAVGHEIDWTISDFVADLRVPTPSAAAELVAAEESALRETLSYYIEKLLQPIQNKFNNFRNRIELAKQHYVFKEPTNMITQHRQRVDEVENFLKNKITYSLNLQKNNMANLTSRLENLNPLRVLKRGYSITTKVKSTTVIKDISSLKEGEELETKLSNGKFISQIKKIFNN